MLQHDFVLLDRSGSMASKWQETLSSINAYVKKLADENVDTGVTLALFDEQGGLKYEVIRERITPKTWLSVTEKEASPRGYTPLNDAIGKIVTAAKAGFNGVQYDKVAIIIMTDGLENASTELSGPQAKALLDECRAKGWQIIFLGADYDNMAQAKSYGAGPQSIMDSIPVAAMRATMMSVGATRSAYGSGISATMEFTDKEKEELRKAKSKS